MSPRVKGSLALVAALVVGLLVGGGVVWLIEGSSEPETKTVQVMQPSCVTFVETATEAVQAMGRVATSAGEQMAARASGDPQAETRAAQRTRRLATVATDRVEEFNEQRTLCEEAQASAAEPR